MLREWSDYDTPAKPPAAFERAVVGLAIIVTNVAVLWGVVYAARQLIG